MQGSGHKSGLMRLVSVAALGALMLGGCSMMPKEWTEWLSASPDEEEHYNYGWEDPGEKVTPEPLAPPDWSEQSWREGAPVTYSSEPLVVEEEKREPVGPVVNSPTRRLEEAENKIENLEVEVAALRQDFKTLLPALRQLMAQRSSKPALQGVAPQSSVRQAMPAPMPRKQTAAPGSYQGSYIIPGQDKSFGEHPRSVSSGASQVNSYVENLRFGDHGKKTRIVLDLARPTAYSYNVDPSQGYLVVDLPGAEWRGPLRGTLNKSPLFTHYTVQQVPGSGSRLMLHLRQPVKVTYADQLDPNSTYRNHRVFLDVVPE